jgi:hypothetical protein
MRCVGVGFIYLNSNNQHGMENITIVLCLLTCTTGNIQVTDGRMLASPVMNNTFISLDAFDTARVYKF